MHTNIYYALCITHTYHTGSNWDVFVVFPCRHLSEETSAEEDEVKLTISHTSHTSEDEPNPGLSNPQHNTDTNWSQGITFGASLTQKNNHMTSTHKHTGSLMRWCSFFSEYSINALLWEPDDHWWTTVYMHRRDTWEKVKLMRSLWTTCQCNTYHC